MWKYSRAEREADGRWLHRWVARVLPWAVPVAVVLALYLGVHYGSFAAAGSDSYGYVSQARLWLDGIPRVEQPWVQDFSWPNREWVFSPLGYRPFSPDGTIVPTYPAGLPMMMAVSLGVLGENGPFYVVPVAGALLLWFTYLLGREATGSKTAGALAALFLLASPVFLAHLLVPMSDVPAAAGWTLVAVLVLKQRALAAGLVSGSDAAHQTQPDSPGGDAGVRLAAAARAARPLRASAWCRGWWPSWSSTRFFTVGRCRPGMDRSSSRMR